jgi:hypothetical protein
MGSSNPIEENSERKANVKGQRRYKKYNKESLPSSSIKEVIAAHK